jgi:hypothetical protein
VIQLNAELGAVNGGVNFFEFLSILLDQKTGEIVAMKKIKLGTEVTYLYPHNILRSFLMFESNVQNRVSTFHFVEPPYLD